MDLGELWTQILEIIAQVIIPAWNDLIQYLPLLLLLLVIVTVAGLARSWRRTAPLNRARVSQRRPAGRPPEDVHLPGPSLWPFVAPVGLLLMVFAVAMGIFDSLANLALLGLGAAISVVAILGWYLDANREYRKVEAGGHGHHPQLTGEVAARPPDWALQPPAGTHLPAPSAWPFLAPVGLLFLVAGFIFGPALIVGGLVMAAIAAIGWLLDADRELDDLEAHGHPSQADRDPEKAWPRRIIPIYLFVGGLAVLITVFPWLISFLPGSG